MKRSPTPATLAALALAWPLGACATGGGVRVDLEPARTAVAEARQAGAPTRSAEAFTRAEQHLQEAEALESGRSGKRDRRGAQRAADLALTEAHCATTLARALHQTEQTTTKAAAQVAASTAEVDRLSARIKTIEDDQHRLEERIAVLTRDLEVTETELIRTKARLKGNETKAEASAPSRRRASWPAACPKTRRRPRSSRAARSRWPRPRSSSARGTSAPPSSSRPRPRTWSRA